MIESFTTMVDIPLHDVDQYFFPVLVSGGEFGERLAVREKAVRSYLAALSVMPRSVDKWLAA
jgi:hypothetical protein